MLIPWARKTPIYCELIQHAWDGWRKSIEANDKLYGSANLHNRKNDKTFANVKVLLGKCRYNNSVHFYSQNENSTPSCSVWSNWEYKGYVWHILTCATNDVVWRKNPSTQHVLHVGIKTIRTCVFGTIDIAPSQPARGHIWYYGRGHLWYFAQGKSEATRTMPQSSRAWTWLGKGKGKGKGAHTGHTHL